MNALSQKYLAQSVLLERKFWLTCIINRPDKLRNDSVNSYSEPVDKNKLSFIR
jgi:hypothetical protein